MKLVLLFGDCAVGKMTVGQELAKITDLRLFHNHMTIEPVLEIFGTYEPAVIEKLRKTVFESFVKTDHYGLIFTFMWAFDCREDWAQTAQIADLFQRHGAEVYYVELVAPQKVRLQRNTTENRLRHKPSKRNIALSNRLLLRDDRDHRMVSRPGELPFANYRKIANAHLSAAAAAAQTKARFDL